MTDIKVGDRVRVVIEGTAAEANENWLFVADCDISRASDGVVSVEKIDPPVEVFGPGDMVRRKGRRYVYSLGHDGYFDHTTGYYFNANIDQEPFTSEAYERVNLDA